MPGIAFLGEELAIKFADGNVRVTTVVILNPFQFLCRVRVWVGSERTVGFIHQGFSGPVKLFIPAQEGRLGNMISPDNKGNAYSRAVKFYGMEFCVNFVWQITLCMCYTIHDG